MEQIIKDTFIITWRYKWFWLLGFLLGPQLIGGMDLGITPSDAGSLTIDRILPLVTVVIGLAIFSFLAAAIVQPTLICAVRASLSGQSITAGESLRSGFDYFGRALLIGLAQIVVSLAVAIMLVAPIVIAFIANQILGIVILLFFLPIVLAALFMIHVIAQNAYRAVVVEDCGIGAASELGWRRFQARPGAMIGLGLISILVPSVILVALSMGAGFFLFFVTLASDSVGAKIISTAINVLISVPIVGFLWAGSSCLWTIAYLRWFVGASASPAPHS